MCQIIQLKKLIATGDGAAAYWHNEYLKYVGPGIEPCYSQIKQQAEQLKKKSLATSWREVV